MLDQVADLVNVIWRHFLSNKIFWAILALLEVKCWADMNLIDLAKLLAIFLKLFSYVVQFY